MACNAHMGTDKAIQCGELNELQLPYCCVRLFPELELHEQVELEKATVSFLQLELLEI